MDDGDCVQRCCYVVLLVLTLFSYCYSAKAASRQAAGSSVTTTTATSSRSQGQGQGGEYCEGEVFTATCPAPDEVLLMDHALYGRMRAGKCIEDAFANMDMGCSANVIGLLDDRCSGRRHCTLDVREIIGYNNCTSKQLRSYLEVRYSCIKVVTAQRGACHGPTPVPTTTSSHPLYLSSYVTQQTDCGGRNNPWSIKANAGQRVSIELVDFAANQSASTSCITSGDATHVTSCLVYATIRDMSGAVSHTVCGCGGRKMALVFVSTSHSVEISIHVKPDKLTGHFLLKYSVDGCANPRLPEGAWMKRDASEAVIGCKPMISSSSDGVMSRAPYFMLKCVNGQWDPPSVKCSSTVAFDGESVSAGGGASASAAAASAHGPHPPGPPAGGFISASRFANSDTRGGTNGMSVDSGDNENTAVSSELLVIIVSVAVACITLAMFILGVLCIRRKHNGPKLHIQSTPAIDHMTYGQTTLPFTALTSQQQQALTSSRTTATGVPSPSLSKPSNKASKRVDPSTTRAAEFQYVNGTTTSSAAPSSSASASKRQQQPPQQHRVQLHYQQQPQHQQQQIEMQSMRVVSAGTGAITSNRITTTTSTLPHNHGNKSKHPASHNHMMASAASSSSATYANASVANGNANNLCIYSNVSSAYNTVNPNNHSRLSPILASPVASVRTPPQPPKVAKIKDREEIYETAFTLTSPVVTESCDDITSDNRQATPQFVVDLKKCMAQQQQTK